MKPPREASNKQKSSANSATQSSDTPGALFPRLHVRETRNAGPRAPPRNKMALYEQFTIPSIIPNQNSASTSGSAPRPTYIGPPQAYAGGYYLPCYIGPPLPYQTMHMTFPGQNLEAEQGELQRVPADNNPQLIQHCQSKAGRRKNHKKTKDHEDFTVPIYTSGAASGPQRRTTTITGETGVHVSPSNSCENNNGELDNQTDEEQQHSPAMSESSDASVLENVTPNKVTAKDIIDAVGEPQFWKMRKAMQRQQRLFQNQVFELHRVTKVQQLMAETSLHEEHEEPASPSPRVPEQQEAAKRDKRHHPAVVSSSKSSVTIAAGAPAAPPPSYAAASAPPPPSYAAATPPPGYDYPSYQTQPQVMGPPYMGYGGQWFTPMYPSPYHHQPYYSTPYGPVQGGPFFSGHTGVHPSFLHYPAMPNYDQQRFSASCDASSAPSVPSKDQHDFNTSNINRSMRTTPGSSSGGFDLIRRAETGSSPPVDVQQEQSGTQTTENQQQQRRVAPKATMVTPESAAGILQSIRRHNER